jgi:polysaccharide pyruvyl transferase WcaK-like protein
VAGYDTIVIGSDEVWNLSHPWYGGKHLFYGVGLRPSRLVSYAASFGSYSCHWGIHDYWAKQLKRFDAVSVRDENSFWLVRGSTGADPTLVLDPCLQFPGSIPTQADEREPYLLIYGHGFSDAIARSARRWAQLAGVRIVSIGYRNDFANDQLIGAGPLEFAQTMAGASAVITNFFHGCVFALRYAKPFAAATSDYRFNKIRDLTAALGMPERVVDERTPQNDFEELLATPPGDGVQSRIGEMRKRSNGFLDAALC